MAPTPPHNGQKALAHQHGDRLTHGGAADPVVALQLLFAGDKIPLFVYPVCDFRLKILFCPTVQRLDSAPLPSSYRRHDIMMSIDTFSRLNRQNKYNFVFSKILLWFLTQTAFFNAAVWHPPAGSTDRPAAIGCAAKRRFATGLSFWYGRSVPTVTGTIKSGRARFPVLYAILMLCEKIFMPSLHPG